MSERAVRLPPWPAALFADPKKLIDHSSRLYVEPVAVAIRAAAQVYPRFSVGLALCFLNRIAGTYLRLMFRRVYDGVGALSLTTPSDNSSNPPAAWPSLGFDSLRSATCATNSGAARPRIRLPPQDAIWSFTFHKSNAHSNTSGNAKIPHATPHAFADAGFAGRRHPVPLIGNQGSQLSVLTLREYRAPFSRGEMVSRPR
jgi:hypothetical protein